MSDPAAASVDGTSAAASAQVAAMEAAMAAQKQALTNQHLAADMLLKHKLTAGRSRNAKLLSEAVKQQDYQDHLKKVAATKQEEELAKKLAGGRRAKAALAVPTDAADAPAPVTPSPAAPVRSLAALAAASKKSAAATAAAAAAAAEPPAAAPVAVAPPAVDTAAEAAAAAASAAAEAAKAKAAQDHQMAQMNEAIGVDGAKEFAAMLQQVSEQQASQDMALARQSEQQSDALMKKLLKGKSTKQKALIEKAFAQSGLVDQKLNQQARQQEDALAARLAAGKKKKRASNTKEEEEQKVSAVVAPPEVEAPVVVDYLEQKYGEMLADEERLAKEKAAAGGDADSATGGGASTGDAAQSALANQDAIATASSLGVDAGADGAAVAQIAAAAAALGLSPEQITAAASAAAQVSAMGDTGEADHANFMELFRKATEDAAAELVRRKAGQQNQDDAFMRKLLQGKKTKQQQLVDKQMADILAASNKALGFQGKQDEEFMRRLAAGKKKAAAAGPVALTMEETNRMAAEALAREMLVGDAPSAAAAATAAAGDLVVAPNMQAALATAALAEEIAAIASAPTILDELLAVSEAQQEEIEKQARETGNSVEDIVAANAPALEVDNMAAELMLLKAREAEASGDAEGAQAFMDMYRRMVEENVSRDSAMKRQMSAAEDALMRKLLKGKSTTQQRLITAAFNNANLVDALMNQEEARQNQLLQAKLALGKLKKRDATKLRAAEDAFAKLRKIFLGAIKKLDVANLIRALEEHADLIAEGYLDLNKPIKDSGESMLHQAAKYGRAEVVEWLVLAGGARPNLPNAAMQTPLHFAALSLDPAGADQIAPDNAATSCMVLIEAGADVNAEDVSLDTPLAIAERYGFDLSNLANTAQAQEALALQRAREEQIAKQKAQMEMNEESSAFGADVMMTEEQRKDAAVIAAAVAAQAATTADTAASPDTAAGIAAAGTAATTAATAAAATLHMDELTSSSSLSTSSHHLTEAQVQLQKDELELLMNEEKLEIIELVAVPVTADSKKTKAANLVFIQLSDLMKDVSNHRTEVEITNLLKAPATIDLVREGFLDLSRPLKSKADGSTLLHAAVLAGKTNLVRQLLQGRADPNKATIQGETALHLASALLDREPHGKAIASLLLEAGATPSLKDFKSGATCYDHAPTPALRQWLEDWKPLAERQRLALANQMNSIQDLMDKNAANVRKAALNAEDSFLAKLMRGKMTRQGKLVDEALKHNDALEARTLTEQQRQLEAMQERIAKGKLRRGGVAAAAAAAAAAGGSPAEVAAAALAAMQMEDAMALSMSTGPGMSGSISAAAAAAAAAATATAAAAVAGAPASVSKKQAFLEDMLLQELSEATQEKILLTAEKWAEHPLGVSGLDIQVLSKLRGMPIADALKLLSHESAQAQGEQLRLNEAINAPGLSDLDALEFERQFNIADCNNDIYSDLTQNMLEAERKRQELARSAQGPGGATAASTGMKELTEEEVAIQLAQERLDDIAAKRKRAAAAAAMAATAEQTALSSELLPAEMLSKIATLFSQYIALHTGYEIEPTLILEGALPLDDLREYNLDVDLIDHMLTTTLGVEVALEFLRKQRAANKGALEQARQQMLQAEEDVQLLTEEQREQLEMQMKLYSSNDALYSNIESVLLGLPAPALRELEDAQAQAQAMEQLAASGGGGVFVDAQGQPMELTMESSAAYAMDSGAEATWSKDGVQQQLQQQATQQAPTAVQVHPDTGLSLSTRIQESVLVQMREIAADFLGLEASELRDMNPEQVAQALAKSGVNIDIMEELRKLTEAEAGKWLAREMASNKAESDMLAKLLRGHKGLTAKRRAELLARQKALDDAADLYNDMLSSLLTGEKKKYAQMSAEEQAAQDKMIAKMAARRRKQEAAELEARKKKQQDEIMMAAAEIMSESSGEKVGRQVERVVPVLDPETGEAVVDPATNQPVVTRTLEMVYESWEASSGELPPPELLEKARARVQQTAAVVHTLIADNSLVLESLQGLAAEHLGLSATEFLTMDREQVAMALAEKGVDINLLDYLKTLSGEEAAKHLARQMAQAEAEAKMLAKLLKGKGLTAAQREELLARQKALEDNAAMYEDMLKTLADELRGKQGAMSAAERAALEAMELKLAQRKARQAAKSKEVAPIDEHSPLLQLFDDLAPKEEWECRHCKKMNEAVNRTCHSCKKTRSDSLELPEIVLWSAHRMLHQCDCPMSVIEVVHRHIGACTKKNFLQFMQACTIACNRDSHVFWDCEGADGDGLGALDNTSAELVWGFNDHDIDNPRYHTFKEKHAEPHSQLYVGWTDFREECVQMPTITDYQ